MSKEVLQVYTGIQYRIDRIGPAKQRLSKIATAIQYRNIPPDLDSRLRLVHERKLAKENSDNEKKKKEERGSRNFGRSQQYVPRTLNDTYNKVALRIATNSAPHLSSLVIRLEAEKKEAIPMSIYLMHQRKKSNIPYSKIASAYEAPLTISAVYDREKKNKRFRKIDIEAYERAGVVVDRDKIAKIREYELSLVESVGSYVRNIRLYENIELMYFARRINFHYVNLSEMELGRKPMSDRVRVTYERFFGIHVPEKLIDDQKKKSYKNWASTYTENELRELEGAANGQVETLNVFLWRERLKKNITRRGLEKAAHMSNSGLAYIEGGFCAVSPRALQAYLSLGISIPENLLEANRKRLEDEKRRFRERHADTAKRKKEVMFALKSV